MMWKKLRKPRKPRKPQKPQKQQHQNQNQNHLILNNRNTKRAQMPKIDLETKQKIKIVSFLRNSKIKSIPSRAFEDYTSLKSVYMENGVTSIGFYAFHGCQNLESIEIPVTMTTMR